jgi:HlyD family secretion protein
VIARLDPLPLETQQAQLQASITQAETQLQQTELQLRLFDAQLAAESQSIAQALSVAQSELSRTQQELSNQRAIAQANLAEAEAVLEFARNEMQQYAQLLDEGAVSQLQVKEKEATVRTAEAQLTRAQVTLDPFTASVAIAQARIDQQQAQGKATLATLNREREALRQQQVKLQSQVVRDRHALQQIEAELQKTDIRATSDGTLFRLNLRNPSQIVQASDVIAEIAPDANALAIKAAVRPQDIDRVQIGLPVKLRITACPYPDFGLLPGTVTAVSPDVIVPDASSTLGITNAGLRESNTYYDITIEPDRLVLERGERQCRLLPGMDVEANIISKEENVLLYLLRKARLLTNI